MALDQAMKYRQYSHSSTLLLRQPVTTVSGHAIYLQGE